MSPKKKRYLTRQTSRSDRPRLRPAFERLEVRQLFAADISFNPATHVVTITGTGNDDLVSVSEYFGIVTIQAKEADYLVDNPNRRCPVIDKARNHLGYDPKVLVDEGVQRSLIWYSHNRVAEAA